MTSVNAPAITTLSRNPSVNATAKLRSSAGP
jgi:hypothetical protein